jgi:hypothetical protein
LGDLEEEEEEEEECLVRKTFGRLWKSLRYYRTSLQEMIYDTAMDHRM